MDLKIKLQENTQHITSLTCFVSKFIPKTLLVFICLCLFSHSNGQDSEVYSVNKLYDAVDNIPALSKVIDITVSGVSIEEFLRGIANSSGLNINVDPSLKIDIVNNFNNVRVVDILEFLARQYNLDISIIGNIINISRNSSQSQAEKMSQSVKYDSLSNLISLDFQGTELMKVAKEITIVSGKNVVLSPGLDQILINTFIQNMPFNDALNQLAYSNKLNMRITDDGFYLLSMQEESVNKPKTISVDERNRIHEIKEPKLPSSGYSLETKVLTGDSISVFAENAPIDEIIKEVTDKLGVNYFISSTLEGKASLNISNTNFQDLLKALLNGTQYTFKKIKDIYLISNNKTDEVKDFRVIQLQDRTISNILEVLPEGLKSNIELKEFPDLNSLLVGGPANKVDELEKFIQKLDKIVPVVLIEVMIVNVNKSYTVTTGIEAGIGDQPVKTQGKVFPELNVTLGAESINKLINSFNGIGSVNIGKVSPNFYLSIQALEAQGILKVYSTPKLSTLNGHEASLTIGSTEYYQEERTDIIGSQNPQTTTSKIYKSVNADLTVTIKPVVSGDDQITMDIEVNQSDFTERIEKLAPPGQVTRKFKSLIRVRNQEMILLGGLEQKKLSDSSSGVPLLSRIPVLRWFFSSRNRVDSNARLSIFIKPTILM